MKKYILVYHNKLKQQLCLYIDMLAALITELRYRQAGETAGPAVSLIAQEFFQKIVHDPQFSLYDTYHNRIKCIDEPIMYYGVKILDCKGNFIDQYHRSIVVIDLDRSNDEKGVPIMKSINDLIDPRTCIFSKEPHNESVKTYLEAASDLINHLSFIKDNVS